MTANGRGKGGGEMQHYYAHRVQIDFSVDDDVDATRELYFRMGFDFGFGVMVRVDGQEVAREFHDVYWGGNWPYALYLPPLQLRRGNHR